MPKIKPATPSNSPKACCPNCDNSSELFTAPEARVLVSEVPEVYETAVPIFCSVCGTWTFQHDCEHAYHTTREALYHA